MSIEDVIAGAMADARDEGMIDDAPAGDNGDGVEVQPATEEDAGTDDVVEPVGEQTDEEKATADAAAAEVKAEADAKALAEKNKGKTPEQLLAEELGPAKNARGGDNKIPHSRVVKIVDNQVAARLDPVRVALGVEAKDFSVDKVVARIAAAATMETEIANNRRGEALMDSNPEKFLRTLAAHHPGYKRFVDLLDGVVAAPAQKPAAQAATRVDPTNDPEPQPDLPIKDADGNVVGHTYTLKGMKARDEWRDRQTEARIFADPRLKNVLARDEADARIAAAEPGLRAQMEDAQTWEGFTDSKDEILAVLVADSQQAQVSGKYNHDLNSAYRKVVLPKLKAAREKAEKDAKEAEALGRKKALADIKKRPVSTSAPAGGGKTPESTGPRDLTDVIKESLAQARGGRA